MVTGAVRREADGCRWFDNGVLADPHPAAFASALCALAEDPSRIALDIEVGLRRVRNNHYEIILDRQAAIAKAIGSAEPGDIVLVAGKGHENYQILSDRTIPFDDREVTRRLLNQTS